MSSLEPIPFDMPPADLEAQVPERFQVTDNTSANWVVRRITEARAYAKRVATWAESEARRARREEEFFLARFSPELQAWLNRELAQRGGKQKSVNLPAGRVGFRLKAAKLVIDDNAAVRDWAKTHCPEAVVTVERLAKTHLNQHFEAMGELPVGSTLEPEHDALYIR
ncbi:MAG: host-nuclease inhibitor Gam family protein [Planctomycetota bacterium]